MVIKWRVSLLVSRVVFDFPNDRKSWLSFHPVSPSKDLGLPGRYKLAHADYPIDYEVFPIYISKL